MLNCAYEGKVQASLEFNTELTKRSRISAVIGRAGGRKDFERF